MDVARLRIDTSGLAERADGDGVVRLGEGEDGDINPLARTSLRPTGRVLRLGVDDERSAVALARLTPPVLDWLAASEATWADDARLSEIAEILDADDDIYAASINVAADATVEVALDGAGPPAIAFGVAYAGVGDTQRTSFASATTCRSACFDAM